jgi:DNA invertase Pin-like site-specific DNA recombinase
MVYGYLRYSTSHQDEVQQRFALDEYASSHGLTIDDLVKDEGISGGVSYRDRNLYKLVRKMKPGDVLITTEISRLGRAISDLNKLVNDELAPRKIRLVVIKMGLDLDCANLKAMDQMILYSFGFAAELEKELIQVRTQSAIDARKEAIRTQGGFMSKAGNWTKKLGAKKGHKYGKVAGEAAGLKHTHDAESWREGSALYRLVERGIAKGWTRKRIMEEALKAYDEEPDKYCTRQGRPLCEGTLSRWIKEIRI